MGPARVTAPPFPMKDLPVVDAVVISHNHCVYTTVIVRGNFAHACFRN